MTFQIYKEGITQYSNVVLLKMTKQYLGIFKNMHLQSLYEQILIQIVTDRHTMDGFLAEIISSSELKSSSGAFIPH